MKFLKRKIILTINYSLVFTADYIGAVILYFSLILKAKKKLFCYSHLRQQLFLMCVGNLKIESNHTL